MTDIGKINSELNRLFDILNTKFYEGKLERPIIIAQSNGKDKSSMGWCTTKKIWKDHSANQYYYEITICAEYLYRNITEICSTLLHEMAHLYNLQNNIKDVSRGNTYHNKHFKQTAEKSGLIVEYDSRIGWSITKLNDETKDFIEANANKEVFTLTRGIHRGIDIPTGDESEEPGATDPEEGAEEKTKQSSRKYICPRCKTIIRATKDVNVICGDCNVPFEKEEAQPDK
jgi:ribosomal protein L36